MTDGGERKGGRDGDDGNSGNHRLTSRDGETRGKRERGRGREEADYLRDLRRPLNPYRKRGVDFISQSENSHQQDLGIRASKKQFPTKNSMTEKVESSD